MMMKKGIVWEKVGYIGVDAGLCWVGDPCYILHQSPEEFPSESLGKTWHEFCDKLTDGQQVTSFPYALGHEGLGVAVNTGYGDGTYPVYVTKEDGRIAGVFVDFMGIMDDPTEVTADEEPEDEPAEDDATLDAIVNDLIGSAGRRVNR